MIKFGGEKFSQLAEMTGGEERRGEESSLVVTDFVSLSHGSSNCAGCARVLARIGMGTSCACQFRDTSDTERTRHLRNSLSTSGAWPDPRPGSRARATSKVVQISSRLWRLMNSEETHGSSMTWELEAEES